MSLTSLKALYDRASREPVLFFGAVGLSITAWEPAWVATDAKKAAVAGILLYLQRIFSTSKKSADENIAIAQAGTGAQVEVAKYVGALEHQATAAAGSLLAAPIGPGAAGVDPGA